MCQALGQTVTKIDMLCPHGAFSPVLVPSHSSAQIILIKAWISSCGTQADDGVGSAQCLACSGDLAFNNDILPRDLMSSDVCSLVTSNNGKYQGFRKPEYQFIEKILHFEEPVEQFQFTDYFSIVSFAILTGQLYQFVSSRQICFLKVTFFFPGD